jgi:Sulfotransferase family
MPEITIDSLSSYDFDADKILGCHIASPDPGTPYQLTSFVVQGWVLGARCSVTAVEVRDAHDVVAFGPVEHERPDVAEHFPDVGYACRSGFAIPVSVVGLPSQFELAVCGVFENGEQVPLGGLEGHHRLASSASPAMLQPLLVTSWGRTGTTWLLRLLGEHPGILVSGGYPYEDRPAVYWMHLLKVLSESSASDAVTTVEDYTHDLARIGRHPVNLAPPIGNETAFEWFGSRYTNDLIHLCRESIQGLYASIADREGLSEARYFAEKVHPIHVPRTAWNLYPNTREVILVRDFRDVLCSIRAFNARRGFAAFGEERATTDAEFVELLRVAAGRLRDAWTERAPSARLLRYEDLIERPAETLMELLEYLDLAAEPSVVEGILERAAAEVEGRAEHITAASPAESIGRWQRDLDVRLASLCEDAFGDILEEFGYSISRRDRTLGTVV